MSTLEQLRNRLGRTWENLTEGWHRLRESAEHAMTALSSFGQAAGAGYLGGSGHPPLG